MTRPAGYLLARADAGRLPLGDRAVSLTLGSPPYRKCRLYLEDGNDLGIARDTEEWIDWMLGVTAEALRVTDGPVVWIAAGSTEDRNYQPICEGLIFRWWQRGGHAYRPCYWHRYGIPGNGGDDWFRADVEYCLCFKRPGPLPWSDNTAMGHPPRWRPGGAMSNRTADGSRVDRWGSGPNSFTGRRPNGKRKNGEPWYAQRQANGHKDDAPAIANPGNLISTGAAGGGHLGHEFAHENEAPYPEALVEFFIRSLCPPGGIVLDPFSGSGTTVSVATRLGRHAIGLDLRQSQCELGGRRVAEQLLDFDRPHRVKVKVGANGSAPPVPLPLFPEDAV